MRQERTPLHQERDGRSLQGARPGTVNISSNLPEQVRGPFRWAPAALAFALIATIACAPQQTAAPAATAPAAPKAAAQSTTAASQPAAASTKAESATAGNAQQEMAELEKKAKEEGEVVVFLGRAGSRQLRDAFPVFEKKYGIKVTQVAGSGNENADKILAERDTGLYTADLWMGGLTTINTRLIPKGAFDPIQPYLMLPEVTDTSKWWKNRHWWGDGEQKHVFLFAASPSPLLSYNTTMVADDEFKSWFDLLDPKWKGKIVSRDPTSAGTGGNLAYFYFHPDLGKEYLRRVYTEMDITIAKDARQAAEWLALGKYAVYLLASGNDIAEAQEQGLPVKDLMRPLKEGARISAGGTGSISVFNKAAHPNATKLFVNWWLSKEGQAVAQKANPEDQTLRTDIPTDDVKPDSRRQANIEYSFLDADPKVTASEGEMLDYMKPIMAGR